jgi:DNA-binding NtrC family response regulator
MAVYAPGQYDVLLAEADPAHLETTLASLRFAFARLGLAPDLKAASYPRDGHEAAALLARLGARRQGRASSVLSHPVVLDDPAMKRLYDLVDRVAASELSVLVLGETGSGKEVIARSLHERSARVGRPFLAINCGGFTEEMLESELFGHEKGAFTGAIKAKPGLLETAQGGTVLLDELGEMSLSTQVKLLRVIEERELRRVGGLEPIPIDVRFVSATNRDLSRAIAQGVFRQDLYYRLNGVTLHVPPLRERRSEIHALARVFAPDGTIFTPAALAVLESYAWPGNVRELRNVVEHAVVLSAGVPIDTSHLPMEKLDSPVLYPSAGRDPRRLAGEARLVIREESETSLQSELSEMERERIAEALETCGGNQSRAAKMLGISRQALVRRLDQYDMPRPRKGR